MRLPSLLLLGLHRTKHRKICRDICMNMDSRVSHTGKRKRANHCHHQHYTTCLPHHYRCISKERVGKYHILYLQIVTRAKQAGNHYGNRFATNTMHVDLQFIHEDSAWTLASISALKSVS